MSHQLALFATGERILVESAHSRIRYIPNVFDSQESAAFFNALREQIPWSETRMWMYDHEVDVPRLVVYYGVGDEAPAIVNDVRTRVESVLGTPFNSVGLNLYRNGNDSVAWHGDKNEALTHDPTVAIVSFGATREILVRPQKPPRKTVSCELEAGSVLVMRGLAQEEFEHHIPKVPGFTAERISIVFRTKIAERRAVSSEARAKHVRNRPG